MRAQFMAIALLAWLAAGAIGGGSLATPAFAIVSPEMPRAMETAPVVRAIENTERDETLDPAQRERILGRLHLIAYAQLNATMTRYSNGEWQPHGTPPCGDMGYYRTQTPEPGARCPYGYNGLAVTRELPMHVDLSQIVGREHLVQARQHYERSLVRDDSNLRAHLGLAYVLDRLNERDAASAHLRRIIELSGSSFHAGAADRTYVEWEDYAVLNEAVEHLGRLAQSTLDRAAVANLRARLGSSRPATYVTPIVIPMSDRPFEQLIDNGADVPFDFAGTGDRRAQGWLTRDAAWLVWDPEWRGEVRSGFDMIGQRTWSVFWSDGFEALRALDDNRDGELTGGELGGLSLWRDENGDGVSDPGEVLPANVHGIAALSVQGERTRPGLVTAGNGVRFDDGTTRPLYDWTPGINAAPVS